MNKQDRKLAAELLKEVNDLQEKASTIADQLNELAEAEREKFDGMPESLQQGERGQAIDECANALREAADNVMAAAASLEEASGNLLEVVE